MTTVESPPGDRFAQRTHRLWVWIHRWVGLAMTLFLVIEGVTGAMLAFRGPLTEFFDPGLYSQAPTPAARPLDPPTLIELAEQREPRGRFHWFLPLGEGVALIYMKPRPDPVTGQPHDLGFGYLALDPWTGREVRRMDEGLYTAGAGVLANLMPFVYELHKVLALGEFGAWVLGITALLWTLDCFAGVYLTFPLTLNRFWPRWKPAWLIKWRARWPRVNLDIHRSFSLWQWLALFIFAWSSVALIDKLAVYDSVTTSLFGPGPEFAPTPASAKKVGSPKMNWHQAYAYGMAQANDIGKREGFVVGEPNGFWYDDENGVYTLRVDTSRRFPHERYRILAFNGDTGASLPPPGAADGNLNMLVTEYLIAFHMIGDPFDYEAFRWYVVVFGVALTAISVTGVVIWLFKRGGRRTYPARGGLHVPRG